MELTTILSNDWWATCSGRESKDSMFRRLESGVFLNQDDVPIVDSNPVKYEFVLDSAGRPGRLGSGHIENLQETYSEKGKTIFKYDPKWKRINFADIRGRQLFLSLRVHGVLVACWELEGWQVTTCDSCKLQVSYEHYKSVPYESPIKFDILKVFQFYYIRGTLPDKPWGKKVLHYLVSNTFANSKTLEFFNKNHDRFFIEVARQDNEA